MRHLPQLGVEELTPLAKFRRMGVGWVWLLALGMVVAPQGAVAQEGMPADGGALRALVISSAETTLASQLGGRITAMSVDFGQTFSKGKVLLDLDCRVQQAEYRQIQREMEGANASLESEVRLHNLGSGGEVNVALARAKRDGLQARLEGLAAVLDTCRIRAPFDGRVVQRLVNPHQSVRVGDPLLEIVDRSQPTIKLLVPSRWLPWLKAGTPFQVTLDETGKTYPAKVTLLGAKVDPVSMTVELRGAFTGTYGELLPGMSGSVTFEVPTKGAR
ncbi:MAG: efflux RND transporter periplasmic adaptor subunit [Magnetococcus sp. WYHC-3]